jgi:hypothetical protein
MANKPHEFPTFSPLDKEIVKFFLSRLKVYISDFASKSGIPDLATRDDILYGIFERIEKKRIYFHIFHNGCQIGELHEGALLCSGILKRRPFTSSKVQTRALNGKIAFSIFFSIVFYVAHKLNKQVYCRKQIMDSLAYDFCLRNYNLSTENILAMAEEIIYEIPVTEWKDVTQKHGQL